MNVKKLGLVAAGGGLIASVAFAAGTLINLSGTSSIALSRVSDYVVGETITTDFKLNSDYSAGELRNILIKSVAKQAVNTGVDTAEGHLDLEVRPEVGGRFDRVAWTLSEDANSYFKHEGFVVTQKDGCCASIPGLRAYDLMTGRLIFPYTALGSSYGNNTPPYSVEIPNSNGLIRYLGLVIGDSTRDFEGETLPTGKQKFATVYYSDGQRILQTADLFGTLPFGTGVSIEPTLVDLAGLPRTDLRGNRLTLWALDGAKQPSALSNFGLRLELSIPDVPDTTAVIAVRDDRLDARVSTTPAGYVLRIR